MTRVELLTVKLVDILSRMNEMLRRRRCLLVSSPIYSVLERSTFAVCLRVVDLEPHLLDNTGPLTRDTAVRRGVSFFEENPLLW